MPVLQQRPGADHVKWQAPAYHLVLGVLKHPIYAGAYVFGRRGNRTGSLQGLPPPVKQSMALMTLAIQSHLEERRSIKDGFAVTDIQQGADWRGYKRSYRAGCRPADPDERRTWGTHSIIECAA
jgi:hypothetical protein